MQNKQQQQQQQPQQQQQQQIPPVQPVSKSPGQSQKKIPSEQQIQDDKYKFQIEERKQFSRQGVQFKLIFFGMKKQSKANSFSPRKHQVTLNDKTRRFQNIPQKEDAEIKPSISFKTQSREQIYEKQKKEVIGEKYRPNYNFYRLNPIKYTIPPIQEYKGKTRLYSPPDCILRGNQCEYDIREKIKNMKKQTEEIAYCKNQLEILEDFANRSHQDDEEMDMDTKKKKMIENQTVEKRKLAEKMIEQEKAFLQSKKEYEDLIEKNINTQEYCETNFLPEHTQKAVKHVTSYDKLIGRKHNVFEQFMPKVEDVEERLYNNFKDFSPRGNRMNDFETQFKRSPLFKIIKTNYGDYNLKGKEEYEQMNYDRSPYLCKVNYKASSKKHQLKKQKNNQIFEKDNDDLILQVFKNQSLQNRQPKNKIVFDNQISRQTPNSMQMRTVKTNMNFYENWKSNQPYEIMQQQSQQQFNHTLPRSQDNDHDNHQQNHHNYNDELNQNEEKGYQ